MDVDDGLKHQIELFDDVGPSQALFGRAVALEVAVVRRRKQTQCPGARALAVVQRVIGEFVSFHGIAGHVRKDHQPKRGADRDLDVADDEGLAQRVAYAVAHGDQVLL